MKIPPFLRKLKLIIQTVPSEIAGWNEDGDVFEVIDPKGFRSELTKHFKGTEQTFIRQLHFYGFTKFDCTRNLRKFDKPLPPAKAGAWSFSHPLLLQSSPDLIDSIQRQAERKTMLANSSDSGDESDDGSHEHASASASAAINGEVLRLKQINKDLNNSILALKKKVTLLSSFLEEQGFDVEDILSNNPSSSSSTILSSLSSMRKRSRGLNETSITETSPMTLCESNQSQSTLSYESATSSSLLSSSMEISYDILPITDVSHSSDVKRSKVQMNNDNSENNFDLQRQASIDYFLNSPQLLTPASSNNEEVDLDSFFSQIDSQETKDDFEKVSENADDIMDMERQVSIDSLDSVSMIEPISTKKQDCSSKKSETFKAEKDGPMVFTINPESIAKIVMHLREALRAAIPSSNDTASQEQSSSSEKAESKPTANGSHSTRLGNLSPRKRSTRRNSQLSKTSSQIPDPQSSLPLKKQDSSAKQLLEHSVTTLLPKLLALPQIREALSKHSNCSRLDQTSEVTWNAPMPSLLAAA